MCTPGGQNVHCGLISLKAGDNWRPRGESEWYAKQKQSWAGQKAAFDLGRAEYSRPVGRGRGKNEKFLAVIYSGKNGAVILSYKLESYYF